VDVVHDAVDAPDVLPSPQLVLVNQGALLRSTPHPEAMADVVEEEGEEVESVRDLGSPAKPAVVYPPDLPARHRLSALPQRVLQREEVVLAVYPIPFRDSAREVEDVR